MKNKYGFTLVEILIALAIIGVVAAMTLPTLITTINSTVKAHQLKVAENRLVQGLSTFNNMENGLSGRDFQNTKEFLEGLSKYYKMTSICDSNELDKCMPYSNISYEKYGKGSSLLNIAVTDLEDLTNIKLDNTNYYAPAGFISASGIPYIVALKKNCIEEPDQPLKNYSQCLDGIFDYNGSRKPNKYGEDIQSLFSARISECTHMVGNTCMASNVLYINATKAAEAGAACQSIVSDKSYTDENGKKYTINGVTKCPYERDYWLAAKIECAKMGLDLPSPKELENFAKDIYGNDAKTDGGCFASGCASTKTDAIKRAISDYNMYRLGSSSAPWFSLWSNSESTTEINAINRDFHTNNTYQTGYTRASTAVKGFCLGK